MATPILFFVAIATEIAGASGAHIEFHAPLGFWDNFIMPINAVPDRGSAALLSGVSLAFLSIARLGFRKPARS